VTGARFLVGDVHERMAELEDGRYDLVICSPPFLALRSYLPDGHPLKHLEIGSEATPAAFLDVMLALTAEWGRLLAPHGSIAIEIGDTYSDNRGGAGGDYADDGLRDGQAKFRQKHSDAWPMAKSLAMIPELYAASLAYGRNLLTGEDSPAGRWRVRNFKPWIRSNPPVGALGDKERPATSYVTVATRATNRYFDLDAVRTTPSPATNRRTAKGVDIRSNDTPSGQRDGNWSTLPISDETNPAGAPPLDWFHQVDAIIDAEIDRRAGKANGYSTGDRKTAKHARMDGVDNTAEAQNLTVGARGVHIRRALERGGILHTVDALDVSPKGYKGAHYAVWPPELVRLLLAEMTPRRVCTTCGEPSRRIVGDATYTDKSGRDRNADAQSWESGGAIGNRGSSVGRTDGGITANRPTVGWSDCGHGGTWRPGRILDPFAGSGTTLAVATGMGMDADGIDIDERNADLAQERVGMFLTVDYGAPTEVAS